MVGGHHGTRNCTKDPGITVAENHRAIISSLEFPCLTVIAYSYE